MTTEKLVTEDFVELLDSKVFTASSHYNLPPGTTLDTTLSAVEGLVLTPTEKLGFLRTYSVPGALNPVVLRADLEAYIEGDDLGPLKDTVATLGDLPLAPPTNEMRAVLDIGAIYRYETATSAWYPFIQTGTLLHTQLTQINTDLSYQHLTSTEKTGLLSLQTNHSHANLSVLESISGPGSGRVITPEERAQLPSGGEWEALATLPSASSINRYVTNSDSRLNTIRNPYITFGSSSSPLPAPTYWGTDILDFLSGPLPATLDPLGAANHIRTIEVLPGDYPFHDIGNYDPLLIEDLGGLTPVTLGSDFQTFSYPLGATLIKDGDYLEFQTTGSFPSPLEGLTTYGAFATTPSSFKLVTPAIQLVPPFAITPLTLLTSGSGTLTLRTPGSGFQLESITPLAARLGPFGPVASSGSEAVVLATGGSTLRGLHLQFQTDGTKALVIEGADCQVEDCSVELVGLAAPSSIAIEVRGAGVTLRRVRVFGAVGIGLGLRVLGEGCTLEDCWIENGGVSIEAEGFRARGGSFNYQILDTLFLEPQALFHEIVSFPGWLSSLGLNRPQGSIRPLGKSQPGRGAEKTVPRDWPDLSSVLFEGEAQEVYFEPGVHLLPNAIVDGMRLVGARGAELRGPSVILSLDDGAFAENLTFANFGLNIATGTSFKKCTFQDCRLALVNTESGALTKFVDCEFTGGTRFYLGGGPQHIPNFLWDGCRFQLSAILFTSPYVFLTSSRFSRCSFYGPVTLDDYNIETSVISSCYFEFAPVKRGTPRRNLWRGNRGPSSGANNELVGSGGGVEEVKIYLDKALKPLAGSGCSLSRFYSVPTLSFTSVLGSSPTALLTTWFPLPPSPQVALAPSLRVHWTSTQFSGATIWLVSVTWRGASTQSFSVLSPRLGNSPFQQDSFTVALPDFGGLSDPEALNVVITRTDGGTAGHSADAHLVTVALQYEG